jgi:hypothetical protein
MVACLHVCLFSVARIEPRVLRMLSKHSVTKTHPQSLMVLFIVSEICVPPSYFYKLGFMCVMAVFQDVPSHSRRADSHEDRLC